MPGVPPNAIDMLKRLGRSIFSRKKKDRRTQEASHSATTNPAATTHAGEASHAAPAGASVSAPVAAAASVGAGAASVAPAVDQPNAAITAPAPTAAEPVTEDVSSHGKGAVTDSTQAVQAELPATEVGQHQEQNAEDTGRLPHPPVNVEHTTQPVEAVPQSAPAPSESEPTPVANAPIMLNAVPEQASTDGPVSAPPAEPASDPVTEHVSAPASAPAPAPAVAPVPVVQQ